MMESRETGMAKAMEDCESAVELLEEHIEADPIDLHKTAIAWGLYRYTMGALAGLMYSGPVDEKKMDEFRVRADVVWGRFAGSLIGANFLQQFNRERR